MQHDPHEEHERTGEFLKDGQSEKFFADLNSAIRDVQFETSVGELSPIIFIVGVPRSGTTLLSQLISRFLEIGYISNLAARFWANPIAGIRLANSVSDDEARASIGLRSVHGTTSGPWGPHEFGYFWREMFGLDRATTHKLTLVERKAVDRAKLSGHLSAISREFGRAVVFKNPICGFQATLLEECYPNSLFILTERDDDSVLRSIRKARVERYGSDSAWWSLKPSTFPEISRVQPAEEQIKRQIVDCRTEFHAELSALSRPFMTVRYDDMRTVPLGVLENIVREISGMGGQVRMTSEAAILKSPESAGLY